MIPVTKPFLPPVEEYERYIREIWKRNWLTNNGPLVNELELKLKDYLEVNHLLFVTNGTIAIQLAIKALGLKGKIITTPFSYVATTSSLVWEGCEPVFVDIDPNTCNLDPNKIEDAITPDTSAILATHVYGNPCDVDAIAEIATRYGVEQHTNELQQVPRDDDDRAPDLLVAQVGHPAAHRHRPVAMDGRGHQRIQSLLEARDLLSEDNSRQCMTFKDPALTFGIEEEYLLVDRRTRPELTTVDRVARHPAVGSVLRTGGGRVIPGIGHTAVLVGLLLATRISLAAIFLMIQQQLMATGRTLSISGTADHDFVSRAIMVNGTVNWSQGRLRSGSGASTWSCRRAFAAWSDCRTAPSAGS